MQVYFERNRLGFLLCCTVALLLSELPIDSDFDTHILRPRTTVKWARS